MIALLALLDAAAHSESAVDRAPVAWALVVEGRIARQDGTWLDAGEAIEVGASFDLPAGAFATVAHNGRLDRWEGPGTVRVGATAARVTLAGHTVRKPHVEELSNALTGDLRAPAGRDQVTSALGIPLTDGAWARQDAIDGGQLHTLYRDVLTDRLKAAGVPREVVEKLDLADMLPGDGAEQVALVGRYLDLADATPSAALLFEVPPTDIAGDAVTRNLGGTLLDTVAGRRPHTFRSTAELDKIRVYGVHAADALRRRGHTVFALTVPYANTLENIVLRGARPEDGVEVLHHLLARAGGFDSPVPTVALGYSQGAAVVRGYVARYGDSDGLDYAIPLATMGGADGAGGDGVWAGRTGALRGPGVAMLAVTHAGDPARWVYGKGIFQLAPRFATYVNGAKKRGGDLALHEGYLGSHHTPLPHRADPAAALDAGTHGYPTAYLAGLFDDLLADRYTAPLARLGDWTWDNRVELPHRARGDFGTWKSDPRTIADGYLPASERVSGIDP